jgi:hypothetical protein
MRRKPSTWLLKIASASALLPGCADEADDEPQATGPVVTSGYDAGHPMGEIIRPPYQQGTIVQPAPWDGGISAGVIVRPQDAGAWVQGLMPQPQDASADATQAPGSMPVPPTYDSGVMVLPPGDAGADAGCTPAIGPGFIMGLFVAPVDSGCTQLPLPGILMRPENETE